MLEVMKIHRLLSLRKQYMKSKLEARKSMDKGDLQNYFEKLKETNRLKSELSDTINMKV